jgi:phospholipid-binding lipoprotein MlaA
MCKEPRVRRSIFAVILTLTALSAASAASAAARQTGAAPASDDPWERVNRRGYAINQFLDRHFIRPAAMIYRALTPGPIGKGLHNMITNLSEPLVFINDVLQARPRRAASTTVRFAFNSTLGLAGLIDVAGHGGIAHHASTFGDTLGRYGVGPGPYIFLPLVGPSTVRDLLGFGVDLALDPVHWLSYRYRTEISTSATVVGGLDTRAAADDELKAILSDAADPYATMRSVYLQYRQGEIEGDRAGRNLPPLPQIDDPGEPAPTPTPALQSVPPESEAAPGSEAPPKAETPTPPDQGAAPAPRRMSLAPDEVVVVRRSLDQSMAFEGLPDQ